MIRDTVFRASRLIGLILSAVACVDSGAELDSTAVVLEPAQVRISRADDLEMLGVQDVLLLEDGRILVADQNSFHLLWFDASHPERPVGIAGKKGSGPGEFRSFTNLLRNGTGVAVFDRRNARFTLFDSTATLMGSIPGSFPFPVFSTVSLGERGALGTPTGLGEEGKMIVWTSDLSLSPLPVWNTLDLEPYLPHLVAMPHIAGGRSGRMLFASRSEYRGVVFDRDGTPLFSFSRDIPPTPRTQADLAAAETAAQRLGGRAADLAGSIENYEPIAGLGEDGCGRIWVLTFRGRPSQSSIFDVFGPDGGYRFEVKVPGYNVREFSLGIDGLVGLTRGELDGWIYVPFGQVSCGEPDA